MWRSILEVGKIDLELISEEIFVNKSAFMHENKVIGRPIMHEIKVIGVLIAREIKVIACGQRIIAHLAFLFWGYPGVCLHSKEAGFGAAAEDYRSPCFSSALVDGYAGGWLQRFWGHPEFVCTLFNLLNKLW